LDLADPLGCDVGILHPLWEELPDETIGVLVSTLLIESFPIEEQVGAHEPDACPQVGLRASVCNKRREVGGRSRRSLTTTVTIGRTAPAGAFSPMSRANNVLANNI